MDIYVYDTNFKMIGILDSYYSLLWNVKYCGYGDFALGVPDLKEITDLLHTDYYLRIPNSDRIMIIEKQEPNTDIIDGNSIKVSGRSLESILKRRIVWEQTILSGNLQNAVKKLITDAIINPLDTNRKISNFIFVESTDMKITSITIEPTQFTGDDLYKAIIDLISKYKIGYKITLNDSDQFEFELISGSDRSSNQLINPIIEFSIKNDNLISSKYVSDKRDYCNVTLVAGEGEGTSRKTATVGSASGLDRRELFTDARDISSNTDSGSPISSSEYNKLLIERGKIKLEEHKVFHEFDSEVNTDDNTLYKFNTNYFLGDIVDFVDSQNRRFTNRIIEITTTITDIEESTYPIFEYEEG